MRSSEDVVSTTHTSPPQLRSRGGKLALFGVLIGVAAIGGVVLLRKAEPPHAEVARDVPRLEGKFIRFSRAFAERSKIEFETCTVAVLSPTVSVTGTVAFDPELVAAIGARISGRVRRVMKFPGDPVKPGDMLAELESAELGQAQTTVLSARAHLEAALANEKREVQLSEAKVSSQRDAELAKATAQAARAELYAAEQRVRAFGGISGGEVGVLQLRSPIGGKVVEAHVSRGQSVEPSHTAFRVADLRRVWIELDVFERELGHIKPADKVEISPQTNAAVVLTGAVAHVGDVIDLDTRSAPVRVVVDNVDGALRPGESVLARIHTRTTPVPAVLLPRDAVTSVDGRPTVFVQHDETSVEPRTVTLGARDGSRVEIASGLTAGEKVTINGVFALKAEIFR